MGAAGRARLTGVERERAQGLTSPVEAGEDTEVHLTRLRGLLRAVNAARGDARTTLAGEVNQVLAKIREPGNESAEARVLVAELDAHAFDDLIDARGVSSRKEAVETLISLGFPHALKVDPEDLAFARKDVGQEENRRIRAGRLEMARRGEEPLPATDYDRKLDRSRKIAVGLASLSSLILLGTLASMPTWPSLGLQLMGVVQALLAVGSTAYLAAARPSLEHQAVPIVGLVFAVVVSLGLLLAEPLVGAIALGGSGAALAALIAWQYDDPRREDGLFPPDRGGRSPFDDSGR